MVTIGIDQSLIKSELYGHRCMENIKKLYKCSGKQDDKQQYKDIIEESMVYIPKGFNQKIPISTGLSITDKRTSARKSLRQFTEVLYVKQKNNFLRLCAA